MKGVNKMIFITLGSQKFQFNRLLKAVDELVEKKAIKDEIFAQIGYSDYYPKYFSYKRFLARNEFADMEGQCDILITHGGTGAIIGAVKKGKKVIAIPRLSKYGEHVDDHQLQIVKQFEEMNLIYACYDCTELGKALSDIQNADFNKYESNTDAIINRIESFIKGEKA